MDSEITVDMKATSLHPRETVERFFARGLELDTCLQVFDTDFHVHSAILKMHSAFFYKFFDSPDKTTKPKTHPRFKYLWVTQYEDAGSEAGAEAISKTRSWHLVADCSAQVGTQWLSLISP